MPSAGNSVLSWTPAAEDVAQTPCGGEHIRGLVIPTTPRSPSIVKACPETPRQTVGVDEIKACPETPRQAVGVDEIKELLMVHSSELIHRMDALMQHQEQVITRLFAHHTMCKASSADSLVTLGSSLVTSQDCMSKIKENEALALVGKGGPASGNDKGNITSNIEAIPHRCSTTQSNIANHVAFKRKYGRPVLKHSSAAELFLRKLWHDRTPPADGVTGRRRFFRRVLNNRIYEFVMTALILFNSLLIIVETDTRADCRAENGKESSTCETEWLFIANLILLVVYSLESLMAVDVYRWKIFQESVPMFEIVIVICGFIDVFLELFGESFPPVQVFKLIRLTRLLRGLRLLSFVHELHFIMNGFLCAMRAMLWGFVLLMFIIIATSIVAVEAIDPVNKRIQHKSLYCAEAFDSVWNATILLFQTIVAGDSWGRCTIEIMKFEPATFIFFSAIVVSIQVGFMNLIMSVIIDRVADAREADTARKLRDKEKQIEESRQKWIGLFDSLDKDGSGELSASELLSGFDTLPHFSEDLKLLGLERSDLPTLLSLMDEDGNSEVSIDELIQMLDMVWHFDNKMHQVTLGMQLRVIAQRLEGRLKKLERLVKRIHLEFPVSAT